MIASILVGRPTSFFIHINCTYADKEVTSGPARMCMRDIRHAKACGCQHLDYIQGNARFPIFQMSLDSTALGSDSTNTRISSDGLSLLSFVNTYAVGLVKLLNYPAMCMMQALAQDKLDKIAAAVGISSTNTTGKLQASSFWAEQC